MDLHAWMVFVAAIVAICFAFDAAYAVGAGVLSRRLLRGRAAMRALDAAAGAVMIALGIDLVA